MFRSNATRIAQRISDVIDDMLVGDFDYVDADGATYADVDYFREHPHRFPLTAGTERRPGRLPHQWETQTRGTAAGCGYQESAASSQTA